MQDVTIELVKAIFERSMGIEEDAELFENGNLIVDGREYPIPEKTAYQMVNFVTQQLMDAANAFYLDAKEAGNDVESSDFSYRITMTMIMSAIEFGMALEHDIKGKEIA